VHYVAAMLGGRRWFHVRLLHVLPPSPPELIAWGGSEDPAIEAQEEAEIKNEPAEWLAQAQHAAQPMLAKAVAVLREARVPARAVEKQCTTSINGQSIVTDILEAAQADRCETIVVGRHKSPHRNIATEPPNLWRRRGSRGPGRRAKLPMPKVG
jgi:nucleotide-binding universal stress UspA family protein